MALSVPLSRPTLRVGGGSAFYVRRREAIAVAFQCDMKRKKETGFTLVEMLVVIAVITVLAALLLPVLSRAKAKAHRTVCINNLRQISLGVRMYSDDSNDASPTAAVTNRDFFIPLYSGYKALMKNYVGLNGASSSEDKLFACPADVFNPGFLVGTNYPPRTFVKQSIHGYPPDYSSYVFNGGDNLIRTNKGGKQTASFTILGLGNVKLSSVKHPSMTIMMAEFPVLFPYSWHEPSSHGGAGSFFPQFNNSKDVVSFVDGHVSYITMYCNLDAPGFAFYYNPPASYDYQWTPD